MGCYFAKVCSSEKEKKRSLVVEVSEGNAMGENMANSFIKYVKYREMALNASIVKKPNMGNLICIKYNTHNDKRIIYNGADLNPQKFDSLYRTILVMND